MHSPDTPPQSSQETVIKVQLAKIAVDLEFGFPENQSIPEQRFSRQLSMYVVHTAFGMRQSHVARLYGRHHSTVGHAVGVTEDLRSDPVFDAKLGRVETFLRAAPGQENFA